MCSLYRTQKGTGFIDEENTTFIQAYGRIRLFERGLKVFAVLSKRV